MSKHAATTNEESFAQHILALIEEAWRESKPVKGTNLQDEIIYEAISDIEQLCRAQIEREKQSNTSTT